MTRFARGKGSKASNEKAPEDGTPWEVMKEQLLLSKKQKDEEKKKQEVEKQRIENYQNFLNEQKVQKRKATWCDFPDTETKIENSNGIKKKKKTITSSQNNNNFEPTDEKSPASVTGKKKKKKKDKMAMSSNTDISPTKINIVKNTTQSLKPKKNKIKCDEGNQIAESSNAGSESVHNSIQTHKVKDKNKKKSKLSLSSNTDVSSKINIAQNTTESLQPKKNKIIIDKGNQIAESPNAGSQSEHNCNQTHKLKDKNKKKTKFVDGQPTRRKEINDRSFQLIVNGKEVELVRLDGFPIMRKDADRIQELKNNMIKKGIPKSEVLRTIKLERRRAEKALARLKKDVCYNCRKGGHNLSDCPDLKSKIPGVDAADGVCFKCGSTEHKQFECRVQKNMDFKFATCFICKEAGHIARQCPDNPKGLYPNGGSCKLCGDVTHLRKDCPTVMDKKEGSTLKLQMLHDDNVEEIAQPETISMKSETAKKPKKIKF